MATPENERREYQRVKLKVPIEIYTENSTSPLRGATSDLSLTGCYIETIFPFPVGTQLEIKLQLEGTLLILGTVVTSDPQVGNGVHFAHVARRHRRTPRLPGCCREERISDNTNGQLRTRYSQLSSTVEFCSHPSAVLIASFAS